MTEETKKPTKVRWLLLALVWTVCMIAYLDRVNLSVCAPFIMEDFGFDKVQFGLTMSAFFLAYTCMQIPGGLLAERYGIRLVGALAILWWSVFTILTPMAAGLYSFIAIRFLFGMGEGPLPPSTGSFLSRWFGTKEKALASSIVVSGYFVGPCIGPPLTVWIVNLVNWKWVFYSYGILGIVVAIIWYFACRNWPNQHPKANLAEVMLITGHDAETAKKEVKHEVAPWKQYLRSSQFWAIGVQYCTCNYIMYLFLSWIPVYLLEARGLTFTAMGYAAAAPWAALCFALIVSGKSSDIMVARGLSKFKSRSVMALIGLMTSGIGLYMGGNAETQAESLVWLTISLGFLGLTYTASWASCQDLGQRFGGSVIAWMNTWANIGGFSAPIVTALLVKFFGWEAALSTSSLIVVVGFICWFFVRPDYPLGHSIGQPVASAGIQ